MFIFHCHRCNEKFRIAPENLVNIEQLSCQNCGLPFPEEAIKYLNALGEAYRDCINVLHRRRYFENGWSITIDKLPFMRPRKVHRHQDDYQIDRSESYWHSQDHKNEDVLRDYPKLNN